MSHFLPHSPDTAAAGPACRSTTEPTMTDTSPAPANNSRSVLQMARDYIAADLACVAGSFCLLDPVTEEPDPSTITDEEVRAEYDRVAADLARIDREIAEHDKVLARVAELEQQLAASAVPLDLTNRYQIGDMVQIGEWFEYQEWRGDVAKITAICRDTDGRLNYTLVLSPGDGGTDGFHEEDFRHHKRVIPVHETQQSVWEWRLAAFGPPKGIAWQALRVVNELAEVLIAAGATRKQALDRLESEWDRQVLKGAKADPANLPRELAGVQVVLYSTAAMAGCDLHAETDAEMARNRAREWGPERPDGNHAVEPEQVPA